MGLYDTNLIRFRPDLPYMTGAERLTFQKLRAGRVITHFRVRPCDGLDCSADVPKSGIKRFCTKECHDRWQADQEAKNEKDGQVD
jgi:hypothetical protein